MDYSDLDDERFDQILEQIVGGLSAGQILAVPGVYEVLSEYFNDDVLSVWEKEETEKDLD